MEFQGDPASTTLFIDFPLTRTSPAMYFLILPNEEILNHFSPLKDIHQYISAQSL